MNVKTKNPSKQRKRLLYDGKLNTNRRLLVAPLEKSLIEKIGVKRLVVRKDDTVKVLRGDHKGKSGKVEKVDYDKAKIYIKDIKNTNSRAQDRLIPFVASNLVITDAVTSDNKRIVKKKPVVNKKVK